MLCRWYKEAIVYSLDVDTFKDGNGDGIGDFKGLTESCRYLSGLGVNCLWLLPFYPSPNRDNGYDVMDYYNIDSRLGTLGDFVEFMDEARDRQLRVMTDLVLNHTSIDHPWFQEARTSRASPFHDYYVWRYDEPPDTSAEAIFPPEQKGIWTYEPQVDGWYLHRFYSHQPDLNVANAVVRVEMKKIMAFWVKLGVSGFRVDAVPYLVELRGIRGSDAEKEFNYKYLRELRDALSWHQGDAIMLAEANVSKEEQAEYFGAGDRMHMVFNFLVNQHIFASIAAGSSEPLARALAEMPKIPEHGQWGMFLRNHDELSLDRLSEDERNACFEQFGPEEPMRIFNRGIRRRLATLLGGDRRKILLAYSLLFSLPGTPVLWYGEEIGMSEDLNLPGRFSVRTPMHWSSENNAGFSSAPAEKLIRPVISEGEYSFEKVNVERQEREPDSLVRAVQRMIRLRQHHPEFGCGEFRLLKTNMTKSVLAHLCAWKEQKIVAVHNFSASTQTIAIDQEAIQRGIASDALGDEERPIQNGRFEVKLGPFGYRWARLRST
jgi:maltose alpha-D-glucosyltransferase/alpha-amylase